MYDQQKLTLLINTAMTAQAAYSSTHAMPKQFRDEDACPKTARELNAANLELDEYLRAGEKGSF